MSGLMSNNSKAEQQIHDMVSQYVKAARAKDVSRIANLYTDDVASGQAIFNLQP